MEEGLAIARVANVLSDSFAVRPNFVNEFAIQFGGEVSTRIVMRLLEVWVRAVCTRKVANFSDVDNYLGRKIRV
jgi:hypothetical protein